MALIRLTPPRRATETIVSYAGSDKVWGPTSSDRWLGDALNVVTENLAMSLRTTFSKSLSADKVVSTHC